MTRLVSSAALALLVAITSPPQQPAVAQPSPLAFRFAAGTAISDVLAFLAEPYGVSVNFEGSFVDAKTTSLIDLDGVTFEQALDIVLSTNNLFYKVIGPAVILIVPDSPQNRQKYEEMVIRTFRLSYADATDMAAVLNQVLAGPGSPQNRPQIQANKGTNSITIRGGVPAVALAERLIENNDKPQAEVVIDIEILEVDRARAKSYGVNLSSFVIGLQYAPKGGLTSGSDASSSIALPTMFEGVTASDFGGMVPSAVVKFLESDSRTRVVAKPSLRGAEGTKITANLGDEIPVPSTTFQPVAVGGTGVNPMTSFAYKSVGINITVTPRVTYNDDILLDLELESSAPGNDINIAGQNLPSFSSRKIQTKLRLRNGESTLLAGLIHDDDRRALAGIAGTIHLPVFNRLFAANEKHITQTEMVMLLTPHIVRTQALTQRNLEPIIIRRH